MRFANIRMERPEDLTLTWAFMPVRKSRIAPKHPKSSRPEHLRRQSLHLKDMGCLWPRDVPRAMDRMLKGPKSPLR